LLVYFFNVDFVGCRFLQIEFAVVNVVEEDSQGLELRMTFEVIVARKYSAALASLNSRTTAFGIQLLELYRESLTSEFVCTFLAIVEIVSFNVDSVCPLYLIMILTRTFDGFD
jgi:hypothetical protein